MLEKKNLSGCYLSQKKKTIARGIVELHRQGALRDAGEGAYISLTFIWWIAFTYLAVNTNISLPFGSSFCLYASYHSSSENERRGRRDSGSRSSAKRQIRLVQGFGTIYKGPRCLESYVSYHAMCLFNGARYRPWLTRRQWWEHSPSGHQESSATPVDQWARDSWDRSKSPMYSSDDWYHRKSVLIGVRVLGRQPPGRMQSQKTGRFRLKACCSHCTRGARSAPREWLCAYWSVIMVCYRTIRSSNTIFWHRC